LENPWIDSVVAAKCRNRRLHNITLDFGIDGEKSPIALSFRTVSNDSDVKRIKRTRNLSAKPLIATITARWKILAAFAHVDSPRANREFFVL
jgi:hypothetical protein